MQAAREGVRRAQRRWPWNVPCPREEPASDQELGPTFGFPKTAVSTLCPHLKDHVLPNRGTAIRPIRSHGMAAAFGQTGDVQSRRFTWDKRYLLLQEQFRILTGLRVSS